MWRFLFQLRTPFHEDTALACLLWFVIRFIHDLPDNRFVLLQNHCLPRFFHVDAVASHTIQFFAVNPESSL